MPRQIEQRRRNQTARIANSSPPCSRSRLRLDVCLCRYLVLLMLASRCGLPSSLLTELTLQNQSWGRILGRIQSEEFSSLLFIVTSSALPWDLYFFKFMQPFKVSRVQLLYTVKEKGGKTYWKLYPLPYGIRNPYRNLKSQNYQNYAQKPQRNCTFMNSASGVYLSTYPP
jgi:hypothetical protein